MMRPTESKYQKSVNGGIWGTHEDALWWLHREQYPGRCSPQSGPHLSYEGEVLPFTGPWSQPERDDRLCGVGPVGYTYPEIQHPL